MSSGRIWLDLAAVAMWLRVVVAVVQRPASRWRTRWLGKGLCVAVSVFFYFAGWGIIVPWGAALVWRRVLIGGGDPFELPMADGRRMR
jgi:hypothetical protein